MTTDNIEADLAATMRCHDAEAPSGVEIRDRVIGHGTASTAPVETDPR